MRLLTIRLIVVSTVPLRPQMARSLVSCSFCDRKQAVRLIRALGLNWAFDDPGQSRRQ